MSAIAAFLIHSFAIYAGSKFADVNPVDFWRAMVVALISYMAMVIVWILMLPVSLFSGMLVLLVGTSIATRMVLHCSWGKAIAIGIVATVVGTFAHMLLRPFGIG